MAYGTLSKSKHTQDDVMTRVKRDGRDGLGRFCPGGSVQYGFEVQVLRGKVGLLSLSRPGTVRMRTTQLEPEPEPLNTSMIHGPRTCRFSHQARALPGQDIVSAIT